MSKKIVKGYHLDSEGIEDENEMLTYDQIIEKLWVEGIVAHKSILVTQKGSVIENVWVYSDGLLSGKLVGKIRGVLDGLPVIVEKICNRDEVTIRIV